MKSLKASNKPRVDTTMTDADWRVLERLASVEKAKKQAMPERLHVVENGANGSLPRGCEIVLDDVEGGNPERDYFLVSVVNGDPDELQAMAELVAARWSGAPLLHRALFDLMEAMESPRTRKATKAWDAAMKALRATADV